MPPILRLATGAAVIAVLIAVPLWLLAGGWFAESLLIAAACAAAAVAVWWLMAGRRTAAVLQQAADSARAIASGKLRHRIESGQGDGGLGQAFNEMLESIEALIETASQEKNRLTAALNSSTDAVIAVDAETRITFANTAAERMFMRKREEMLGNPFVWVMPHQQVVDVLRSSGGDGARETHLVERPNRQFFRVIITPIVGGGDWASLVVFHDLSDVKRVEQVRRDFVANVSHELRTPLAALKSVIETLEAGALDEPEVARDFLSRADGEVERLVQMVEELLELSRIESGEVPMTSEPLDVAAVISSAVERLQPQAEKRGLRLEIEAGDVLPPLVGDRTRLERAVVNLVQNALRFTPQGGSVTVEARAGEGRITVSVRDTGVGIDPDDLPRVFERFYKADRARHAGGTGLGLAVVRHTIEAHGGMVWAESEPGEGSMFSFSLPIAVDDS